MQEVLHSTSELSSQLYIPKSNPGVDIRNPAYMKPIELPKAGPDLETMLKDAELVYGDKLPQGLPKPEVSKELSKDIKESLYKTYRHRAKRISPNLVMPRRIFDMMIENATTYAEGFLILEKFFAGVIEHYLPDLDEPEVNNESEPS